MFNGCNELTYFDVLEAVNGDQRLAGYLWKIRCNAERIVAETKSHQVNESGEWLVPVEEPLYPAGSRWPYPHRGDGTEAPDDHADGQDDDPYPTDETTSFPRRRSRPRSRATGTPPGGYVPGSDLDSQPRLVASQGALTGVPPAGKNVRDLSDPNEVDEFHVHQYLRSNYPESAISWVRDARWLGPVNIPQDRIDYDDVESWAASHDKKAVKKFARHIANGTKHTNPVVMVQTPNDRRCKVVDGHHRTLAYLRLGRPVKSYVGLVPDGDDRWEETHSSQFHSGSDPKNKHVQPMLIKAAKCNICCDDYCPVAPEHERSRAYLEAYCTTKRVLSHQEMRANMERRHLQYPISMAYPPFR